MMTLTEDQVVEEARRLDEAEETVSQVRPVTDAYPDAQISDAYRIQSAWRQLKLDRGEEIVGHKIGLTSRAMQQAMKIETPDSGFLTRSMEFAPDTTLATERFCDPKLEIELAFVLGADLAGVDLSIDHVLNATEYIVPAVELIDARSWRRNPETGKARTVVDTISDNAANAGIICGGERVDPRQVDLRWVSALGYRNGIIEETGVAAGVLDHPARGISWLAQRYHEQNLSLLAGQTILAGSFTRPIDVRSGDHFSFDYGPLGSFTVSFS